MYINSKTHKSSTKIEMRKLLNLQVPKRLDTFVRHLRLFHFSWRKSGQQFWFEYSDYGQFLLQTNSRSMVAEESGDTGREVQDLR